MQEQVGALDLGELGYYYINPGKGSWQEGDSFSLELLGPRNGPDITVKWFFDGEQVRGNVILTGGYHVLEAQLEYDSGVSETISKEFNIR